MTNWVKFDKDNSPTTCRKILVWNQSKVEGWFQLGRWSNKFQCFRDLSGLEMEFATHYMIPAPPTEQPDPVSHHRWCNHCNRKVGDHEVTYEELHESCGYPVGGQPDIDQPDTVSVPRVLDTFDNSWFKGLLFDAESESMNGPEVWKEIVIHFGPKEQSV